MYPTPCVLGHESAGVVEAVGDQVTYVQPGDHVITCLSVYCGDCEHCLTGHLSLCDNKAAVQRALDGPQRLSRDDAPVWQFLDLSSFAEQMLVHEHALVKIRDGHAARPGRAHRLRRDDRGSARCSTRPRSSRARRWP